VIDLGAIRRLLTRPLVRQGALSYVFTAGILVVNLITGILAARVLGADGRGELTAVSTITLILVYLFAFGGARAVAYHQARHPEDGPRLLGTWFLLSLPLSALGVIVGELMLPVLLAAQTEAVLHIARLFLLTLFLTLWAEPLYGVLLGDQDFLFWNAQRLAQPVLTVVGYLCLWQLDALTVESALVVLAAAGLTTSVATAVRVVRRHGIGRPSADVARSTLWYGVRTQAGTLTVIVNARLDLLIMPAFLGATSVGLYSVATSLAWIVAQLSGSLWWLVLPAAARRPERGRETVLASFYATLAIGTVFALGLGLVADLAIRAVYGAEFGGAAEPLRLMLPGIVCQASGSMVASGMSATGRPFTATIASFVGAILTVTGLLLFLRSGGINAAALVTTASYVVSMVLGILIYRRVTKSEWRDLLPSPSRLVAQVSGR
jgi:O-antigen/teichoic acid export membrane protein